MIIKKDFKISWMYFSIFVIIYRCKGVAFPFEQTLILFDFFWIWPSDSRDFFFIFAISKVSPLEKRRGS